ncbi:metallophosphoesterase [Ruminococcus sp. HUN007]|uniref:metallophosphoesterase n=1 Tax=Ruminococcus sp. HUN007 TaxID=1514668 RepID=UPI0005D13CD4|nr:metallophosphoesterase [Ruminococcus sp. HUN007]
MTYVMSDLHGEYRRFLQMLDLIGLTDEDILYILGDVVDRGEEPVNLLMDLMKRKNVITLMGNHDYLACELLKQLVKEITPDTTSLAPELMNQVLEWMDDGGINTMLQFRALEPEQREAVLNFISGFPFIEIVEIGEKCYIMSHAGLGNFEKNKKLKEYTVYELIAARPDADKRLFEDDSVFVVCGHTPTCNLCGENRIYINQGNIFIDCGAVFGGKLGCLCLDTMEEFYV